MNTKIIIKNQFYNILFTLMLSTTVFANDVTEQDFEVNKTQDLVNLCTVSIDDPLYKEALHFCHGYLIGAFHFYEATHPGPDSINLFCTPDPKPSRNDTIEKFISWAEAHPEHMNEVPVETEFRFLADVWPCE